nr:hypothetical protein [Angustibacter aerolatus]
MRFIDAVADVMARRMQTDPTVVVMGEDVHRLNGGTNGATRGLKDAFPDRVLGTPISENAFTGLGGGIAMDGRFKPVVEFMYADFMWVAADQPVQPDRQGAAHVRRRRPRAVRAAQQGRHGHRVRLAALHGPGRRLRDRPGVAGGRAVQPVRLRRAAERRAAVPRPGGGARARRPLRQHRRRSAAGPRLRAAAGPGGRRAARRRPHDHHVPGHDVVRAEGPGRAWATRPRRRTWSTCAGSTARASTGTRSARASGAPTRC